MINLKDVSGELETSIGKLTSLCLGPLTIRELILSSVSEVEQHVDDMLIDMVQQPGHRFTEVSTYFIDQHLDEYLKTWKAREKFLKDVFHVSLSGESVGQKFTALLDVRNALMHGNGFLTKFQIKNPRTALGDMDNISRFFDIVFCGKELVLERVSRQKICDVSVNYLLRVDQIRSEDNFRGLER